MSKGYKKEYITKVKEKFNDLQSNRKGDRNIIEKSCNDKGCKIRNTGGMVSMGK